MRLCPRRFDHIKTRYMSLQQQRQKLQRVIFLATHHQLINAEQAAALMNCHPSTVKRIIIRLRLEGYDIRYEKSLGRYVLLDQTL